MSKKKLAQPKGAGVLETREQIAAHNQAVAEKKPQLAPVAVLTITFLPPLNQIANIQAVFPFQMDAASVLHILRRAEESLIAQVAQAEAQKEAQQKHESA